jgi:hypothetical protein
MAENLRVADGCPCNSGRGDNHGIVPKDTCTCAICDPAQTGSTRPAPLPPEASGPGHAFIACTGIGCSLGPCHYKGCTASESDHAVPPIPEGT